MCKRKGGEDREAEIETQIVHEYVHLNAIEFMSRSRTSCGSWFTISTIWGLRIELRSFRLASRCFYILSHFAGPIFKKFLECVCVLCVYINI